MGQMPSQRKIVTYNLCVLEGSLGQPLGAQFPSTLRDNYTFTPQFLFYFSLSPEGLIQMRTGRLQDAWLQLSYQSRHFHGVISC